VAEGIETENELLYLQDHTGISYGQGFLFHRPAFIDDLLSSAEISTRSATRRA